MKLSLFQFSSFSPVVSVGVCVSGLKRMWEHIVGSGWSVFGLWADSLSSHESSCTSSEGKVSHSCVNKCFCLHAFKDATELWARLSTASDNLAPLCFPHSNNDLIDYSHKLFLSDMSDYFKLQVNSHVNLFVSDDRYFSFLSQRRAWIKAFLFKMPSSS